MRFMSWRPGRLLQEVFSEHKRFLLGFWFAYWYLKVKLEPFGRLKLVLHAKSLHELLLIRDRLSLSAENNFTMRADTLQIRLLKGHLRIPGRFWSSEFSLLQKLLRLGNKRLGLLFDQVLFKRQGLGVRLNDSL